MMESAMITLSKQFYYGSLADANGHPGVRDCVDSSMVIDNGYTNANALGSTIWAVRWGMMDTGWLWGLNGQLLLSAVKEIVMVDPNNSSAIFTQYHQEILARPGPGRLLEVLGGVREKRLGRCGRHHAYRDGQDAGQAQDAVPGQQAAARLLHDEGSRRANPRIADGDQPHRPAGPDAHRF